MTFTLFFDMYACLTAVSQTLPVGKLRSASNSMEVPSRQSVTRLTKYLPEAVKASAMNFIEFVRLEDAEERVQLVGVVTTGQGLEEQVFELNGLALPAMFESRTTKAPSTIQAESKKILSSMMEEMDHEKMLDYTGLLDKTIEELDNNDPAAFLRMAAIYTFAVTGYANKAVQLKSYDWITKDQAETCIRVLAKHLKGETEYEVEAEVMRRSEAGSSSHLMTIVGRIDALTASTLWVS